jgi:hypothetical protein
MRAQQMEVVSDGDIDVTNEEDGDECLVQCWQGAMMLSAQLPWKRCEPAVFDRISFLVDEIWRFRECSANSARAFPVLAHFGSVIARLRGSPSPVPDLLSR